MVYAGRYIFSLPFVLAILPLIKTKAGISLFQLLRLWGLFRVLRNSGRFNFNNFNQANTQQNMNLDEAYKILNLDPKNLKTLYNLGTAHLFLGNTSKAREYFENTIEIDKFNIPFSNFKVLIHLIVWSVNSYKFCPFVLISKVKNACLIFF